jgi:hypothetical protein
VINAVFSGNGWWALEACGALHVQRAGQLKSASMIKVPLDLAMCNSTQLAFSHTHAYLLCSPEDGGNSTLTAIKLVDEPIGGTTLLDTQPAASGICLERLAASSKDVVAVGLSKNCSLGGGVLVFNTSSSNVATIVDPAIDMPFTPSDVKDGVLALNTSPCVFGRVVLLDLVGAGGSAPAQQRKRKTLVDRGMDWAAGHGGHDAHLADVEGLREAVALTAEVVSKA